MDVKKLVGLIAIALLLFFVFTEPTNAAGSVHSILALLQRGAEAVVTFFKQVI